MKDKKPMQSIVETEKHIVSLGSQVRGIEDILLNHQSSKIIRKRKR